MQFGSTIATTRTVVPSTVHDEEPSPDPTR
jgi:hypothetical protein